MSKQEKKGLVPVLRFPEFRDEEHWEKTRLGEISERIVDKVGNKKLTTVSITAGRGFVSQAEKFSRDISGKQYKNYIFLRKGEFSYNKGNSKTFPQGCIYKLKEFEQAAVPNAFISFRFKKNYVPDFYQGYFDNNYHGKQLTRFITSGARSDGLLNISPDEFFSIVLPTPTHVHEQQKIADCLSSIDELITAQGQKLEALKDHKKGLMQQLFPAEGETIPRRRFPEFRDTKAWRKEFLGNCTNKVGSGITPKGGYRNYKSKGRPFIRSQNIGWGRLILDEVVFIDDTIHSTFSATEIKEEDVLLNITGASIGRSAVADLEIRGGNVNQHVCIIRTKRKNLNPFFLVQFLVSQSGQNQISNFQAGGNRQGLNFAQIRSFSIPLPFPAEQQKIADCLSSIDELISAQAQILETLKDHKKGLMQQLFPAIDEVAG